MDNPSRRETVTLTKLGDHLSRGYFLTMIWTNPLTRTITIDLWQSEMSKSNLTYLFNALSLYGYEISKVEYKTSTTSFYFTLVISKKER